MSDEEQTTLTIPSKIVTLEEIQEPESNLERDDVASPWKKWDMIETSKDLWVIEEESSKDSPFHEESRKTFISSYQCNFPNGDALVETFDNIGQNENDSKKLSISSKSNDGGKVLKSIHSTSMCMNEFERASKNDDGSRQHLVSSVNCVSKDSFPLDSEKSTKIDNLDKFQSNPKEVILLNEIRPVVKQTKHTFSFDNAYTSELLSTAPSLKVDTGYDNSIDEGCRKRSDSLRNMPATAKATKASNHSVSKNSSYQAFSKENKVKMKAEATRSSSPQEEQHSKSQSVRELKDYFEQKLGLDKTNQVGMCVKESSQRHTDLILDLVGCGKMLNAVSNRKSAKSHGKETSTLKLECRPIPSKTSSKILTNCDVKRTSGQMTPTNATSSKREDMQSGGRKIEINRNEEGNGVKSHLQNSEKAVQMYGIGKYSKTKHKIQHVLERYVAGLPYESENTTKSVKTNRYQKSSVEHPTDDINIKYSKIKKHISKKKDGFIKDNQLDSNRSAVLDFWERAKHKVQLETY